MQEVPILEAPEVVDGEVQPELPTLQVTVYTRDGKKFPLQPGALIDGPFVQGFLNPKDFITVPLNNVSYLISRQVEASD